MPGYFGTSVAWYASEFYTNQIWKADISVLANPIIFLFWCVKMKDVQIHMYKITNVPKSLFINT